MTTSHLLKVPNLAAEDFADRQRDLELRWCGPLPARCNRPGVPQRRPSDEEWIWNHAPESQGSDVVDIATLRRIARHSCNRTGEPGHPLTPLGQVKTSRL